MPDDTPALTGIAPQFPVDDLDRAIATYRDRLGFALDFQYAAPKTAADREHRRRNEHLDAFVGVPGLHGGGSRRLPAVLQPDARRRLKWPYTVVGAPTPTAPSGPRRALDVTGEKIYAYDLDITGTTDFGISLEAILSGQTPPPPQGVRIDVAFAGRASGRIGGQVRGTDHLCLRADGRIDLDIRAVLETDDGHRIALAADGVATLRADAPVADLRENVRLTTASPTYAWVNARQVWAVGTVDLASGKIRIEAYLQ